MRTSRRLRRRMRGAVRGTRRRYAHARGRRRASVADAPVDGAAVADAVAASRAELERILVENVVPFWYPRVIDEAGGYHLNHDREGRSLGDAPKGVVGQSRVLWFFARLSRSRWGGPEHLDAARHGYRFLVDHLWDREHGGVMWERAPSGETTAVKESVGQVYALFALAEYARASGDESAAAAAGELWRRFDDACHDDECGGYFELRRADWGPPDTIGGPFTRDARLKRMAVQLHALEALLTCVDSGVPGDDDRVRDRLFELVLLLGTTAAATPGRPGHEWFERDWSPYAHDVRRQYGHDVELIWMLQDAWRALGLPATAVAPLLSGLFDDVLRFGYDHRDGGFHRSGISGRYAHNTRKLFWAQAEGLLCSLRLYQLTGTPRYGSCFLGTLDWITTRQVDWEHGDWHERIDPRGRPEGLKAWAWKEPYHHGRALLECLDALDPT